MTGADWAMLIFAGVLLVLMPIACDANRAADKWVQIENTIPERRP